MEGVEGGVGLSLFVIRRRGLNDNEGIWRVMSGAFPQILTINDQTASSNM